MVRYGPASAYGSIRVWVRSMASGILMRYAHNAHTLMVCGPDVKLKLTRILNPKLNCIDIHILGAMALTVIVTMIFT